MTRILAIDPGTVSSAWVDFEDDAICAKGIVANGEMLGILRGLAEWSKLESLPVIVIEKVASYGMPVGAEVFETVFWTGRFAEAAAPLSVVRVGRKPVVLHLCGSTRAKDPNVRRALMDRFGGDLSVRKGGRLNGVSKDVWSALALAVAYSEGVR